MSRIQAAEGARITAEELERGRTRFFITDYGAAVGQSPVENTRAIQGAIEQAAVQGGCVVIPPGEFQSYTIRLRSRVSLYLSQGALLRAAKPKLPNADGTQEGEDGNYDEPEVNHYAGLQDHGHSYFANSLIYAADLEQIMIYGPGTIDGSAYEDGFRHAVLEGRDPQEPLLRSQPGHRGVWFGNKAIALVRCRQVVLQDFSLVIGGHFAVIAEGVQDLLIQSLCVDTTRDALDLDCCQDVTVRDCVLNSLTDDALVMKASYGAGSFLPTQNVLIEDCTVSGYDAGSVYAGTKTCNKLIAADRCGPTGRVKFGTESTCGYHRVTIQRVRFERSRGFAMEAVDGSDLTDVLFTDCTMDNVSSSPIFIRIGDRCRYPVTGMSQEETLAANTPNVRLDNSNWVLPDTPAYQSWPARRFVPSYQRNQSVCVDGCSSFLIVSQEQPVRINPANFTEKNGHYYAKRYEEGRGYVTDYQRELSEGELAGLANACGSERMARIENVEISRVRITNADPRYPILLMGLTDSKIRNVILKDISVEYRGGLTMEHAVEQRQLNTHWEYAQYEAKPAVQTLPWLVNSFFVKNEGLLPRVDWDCAKQGWKEDPYNVPELPDGYPEPSNWGILPAYGMYVRHLEGLTVQGLTITVKVPDSRHAIVLDDVRDVQLEKLSLPKQGERAALALVTNSCKRPAHWEYVKDTPYFTTTVSKVSLPSELETTLVHVKAPAPGTPRDHYYPYPTVPTPENGYEYSIPTEEYPLPKTVFRPFLLPIAPQEVRVGETLQMTLQVRNPAAETAEGKEATPVYQERIGVGEKTVAAQPSPLRIFMESIPEGAKLEEKTGLLTWTPQKGQEGSWKLRTVVDDGWIPEAMEFTVCVVD